MKKFSKILEINDYDEENLVNNSVIDVLIDLYDNILLVVNDTKDGIIAMDAAKLHDYDFFTKDIYYENEEIDEREFKSVFNGNPPSPIKVYSMVQIEDPTNIDEIIDFYYTQSQKELVSSDSFDVYENKVHSAHKQLCNVMNIQQESEINPTTMTLLSSKATIYYTPASQRSAFPGIAVYKSKSETTISKISEQDDLTILVTENKMFPIKTKIEMEKSKAINIHDLGKIRDNNKDIDFYR